MAVVASDGCRPGGTIAARNPSATRAMSSPGAMSRRRRLSSAAAGPNSSASGMTRSVISEAGRPRNGRKPAGRNMMPSAQPASCSVRQSIFDFAPWTSAVPSVNTTLTAGCDSTCWV